MECARKAKCSFWRETSARAHAFSLQQPPPKKPGSEASSMSREELALETQLLLQEVSQVTQYHQTEAILDEATATAAPVSQYEEAKQALLEKLKKKKEQKRQQMQQVNQRRYGIAAPSAVDTSSERSSAGAGQERTGTQVSPMKQRNMMKLPVAANAGAASRKKKDLLSKLRSQAIQQGMSSCGKPFVLMRGVSCVVLYTRFQARRRWPSCLGTRRMKSRSSI